MPMGRRVTWKGFMQSSDWTWSRIEVVDVCPAFELMLEAHEDDVGRTRWDWYIYELPVGPAKASVIACPHYFLSVSRDQAAERLIALGLEQDRKAIRAVQKRLRELEALE